MREIKFRGKRKDTNQWICGNLFIPHEMVSGHYISPSTSFVDFTPGLEIGQKITNDMVSEFSKDGCVLGRFMEVIPETVGQFTGLMDKYDCEVYVGHIVRCTKGCAHAVELRLAHGGTYIGGMPTFYLSGLNDGYAWTGKEEIIGNAYENPELLNET